MRFFFAILMCFSAAFSQSPVYKTSTHYDEPESESRERVVDFERMKVDVRFAPKEGKVFGVVTHSFVPLRNVVDSLTLDAVSISVSSVTCRGEKVRFTSTDSLLIVYPNTSWKLGKRDSIVVSYSATPRKGLFFIGWNDSTNRSRKQIWTQGQATDNRYWIPMWDHPNDKMITETVTTIEDKYSVLSNGTLLGVKKNGNGTSTWHYTMTKPHSPYLLMLGIGEYGIEKRYTKKGLPVNLWYYPDQPERVKPTYKYSTESIEFMEETLGIPFPWESYSQIPLQDYTFGAMENTTATVFGDFYYCDERGNLDREYIGTNVHELTHQWFGDLITQRDEKSIWLHESFATFYPKLFRRKYFGEDFYQWMRRGEQNQSLKASEKDKLPIVHPKAGQTRIYPKGSTVLDMMMYTFGEEEYHRVIQYYLRKHSYKNVHTVDLYQAFMDTLGVTPDWFFDEWLYRGGEPAYKVHYNDTKSASGARYTEFVVEQTHETNELTRLFTMPIVFEVHYTDGSFSSVRATVQKQQEVVRVPNPQTKEIAYTLFDPGSYILKKVEFAKSFAELKQQALKAKNMIDRYDAVVALDSAQADKSTKYDLYSSIFAKETFHAVKAEIIKQVCNDDEPAARALVEKAIQDSDVEVRKAAVTSIRRIPETLRAQYEKLLSDKSYSVIESALQKLCAAFPNKAEQYLAQTAKEGGNGLRVRIKNLEIRAERGDADSKALLSDYAGNSFEFITRQNAMNALKRINHCDTRVVHAVIDALFSQNNRLSGSAKGVIEYFVQQSRYRTMFWDYYNSVAMRDWQKDMLRDVIQ